MMVTGIRLFAAGIWIGLATASSAVADGPAATWKVGDTVPAAKAVRLEGISVDLRPPADKFLLVLAVDDKDEKVLDRVKAAVTLFRRFHAKGLNAVQVWKGGNEAKVLTTAARWQIPWPLLIPKADDDKVPTSLAGLDTPASYLIDSQGKVVAVDLGDEKAHETVAKLLGVSLDSVPMPKPPEPRKEEKQNAGSGALTGVEGSVVRLGSSGERADAEPCRKNLRLISIALTEYRVDHKDELPQHLSDLFPKYLQDEKVLLCPAKPEALSDYKEFADPKIKCSYLYEFSPEVRAKKTGQLEEYGDRVAMVRCKAHNRWLSLSYGGEIYFSRQVMWENDCPQGASLKDDDAKVREQLRSLALALAKYRRVKGEVPDELADLYPDYVKDKALFTCVANDQPLSYQFSASTKYRDETYRSAKLKQLKDKALGEYVPVIRVKGILPDGQVINLSYGGEIYESPAVWEDLFK
jgi:hypothetical protein